MNRVTERETETDRERFDVFAGQCLQRSFQRLFVQCLHDRACRIHALRYAERQAARHQRRDFFVRLIEQAVALVALDFQQIAKAFGYEQRRARAGPLQHGVRCDGARMRELADAREIEPKFGMRTAHADQHGFGRIARRRSYFQRLNAAAVFVQDDKIGEGAADVDGNAVTFSAHCSST
jgi:hypothetical protein